MAEAEGARWERWVWILLVVLLPLGEGGAGPEGLALSHSLVLLLAALQAARHRFSDVAPLPTGLRLSAPVLLAVTVAAAVGSPYPYASFLRCWDLSMLLLVFVLARRTEWGTGEGRILFDAVLVGATAQAFVTLSGLASGRLTPALGRFGLLNSNHQAAYLNLGILLAAPGLLLARGRGKRIRVAAVLICLLAACLLASRGALMGLALGAGIVVQGTWRRLAPRSRLFLGGLLLALGLGAAGAIWSRFAVSEDPFRYERVRIWEAAVRCLQGSPFLGVGPGIYRHLAHRFNFPLEGPVRYGRTFQTAHSDVLEVLVETGILGGTAAFLLVGSLARFVRRQARENGGNSLGLFAAFGALAAQAVVEDLTQRPAIVMSLVVLIAASSRATPVAVPVEQKALFRPTARFPFLPAPIVLAWVAAVLNPYLAYRDDRAMRHSRSFQEMEKNLRAALRHNPYQADTYRFPASVFLGSRPPPPVTPEVYARLRLELDEGVRQDRTSADLEMARARLEVRAFRDLFRDATSRDRAIRFHREGVLKAPHDPRPRLELAAFLLEVGRRMEALRQVEKALGEEPCFLKARLLRVEIQLLEGRTKEARDEWNRLQSLRKQLATYRPESPYAAEITSYPAALAGKIEQRLGPL